MRSSGWKYDQRFRELDAAQKWGCPSPGHFDALDKTERIDIIAWYEARWRIDAINSYEAQEEAKREAKRKSKKGKRR